MAAFFRLPLNLPHAGTLALRIAYALSDRHTPESRRLAGELSVLLLRHRLSGENPPEPEAAETVRKAAALGRDLVAAIEREQAGHDRIGQFVRNLFECLELGEDGAAIGLRAGENPDSVLRPQ